MEEKTVDGIIGFYHLEDWWLSTFTEEEQILMSNTYQPMGYPVANSLTEGKYYGSFSNGQPYPLSSLLSTLACWFRKAEHKSIADRIRKKMAEVAQDNPVDRPGFFNGRHYTTYVEEVKELKRQNQYAEAELLLLNLIDAVEKEHASTGYGLAGWYYGQLGIIYRKQKRPIDDLEVSLRYSIADHDNKKCEEIQAEIDKLKAASV